MYKTHDTRTTAQPDPSWYSLGVDITGALHSLWHGLARPHRERQTIARLKRFDDHLMHDIGISRFEIEEIVCLGTPVARKI